MVAIMESVIAKGGCVVAAKLCGREILHSLGVQILQHFELCRCDQSIQPMVVRSFYLTSKIHVEVSQTSKRIIYRLSCVFCVVCLVSTPTQSLIPKPHQQPLIKLPHTLESLRPITFLNLR